MTNESIVTLNHVSFRYDREKVLDDITLSITRGEFLGIIGPNGSGKTTLLRILLGLTKPDQGTVSLFGTPIEHFSAWSKIGYVPQKVNVGTMKFPITVEEVVHMTGTQNSPKRITEALDIVGMTKLRKSLLSELSGGQQQRVFIARALVSRPELLILDEPTVGVDVDSQSTFYELLKSLNIEQNLTLALVSHDIDVVAHEVSTVACINKQLISHGPPKEVLQNNFMEKLYGKNLRMVVHGH
jgi:zinc transport system ATP-binding protein